MNIFRSTTTTPIASNSLNRSHFRRTTLPARVISFLLTTISFSQAATIITFDAPGAGTGGPFQGTLVAGINPAGVITGGFLDANEVEHTYLRFPDGTFTTFDAPGAGTGPFQGTGPNGINPAGAIVGPYTDASHVNHSFVRAKNGTITTFDAPGAGTGPGQGSFVFSEAINHAGAIAGAYFDSSNVLHGFLRTK